MIIKYLKRIIFSFFILYSFNLISTGFNLIIPINIITIIFVTLFDIPGLLTLIFAFFVIF